MKSYHSDVVETVRGARMRGQSIKSLQKQFGISNTVISRWTHDLSVANSMVLRARKTEKTRKEIYQKIGNIRLSRESKLLCLALLYWCEGSKYPASNNVAFSNSDPSLIKSFLQLFRDSFPIDEKKFRVHLQLHSTHRTDREFRFWNDLLHIPVRQFYSPTITEPHQRRKRLNYHGTCTIKYHDVRLQLGLAGIVEVFAKRFWKGGRVV